MDLSTFFEQYEALVKQATAAFESVKSEYGDCVQCKLGCSDCCHALFDLTLIEAIYIKTKFNERVIGDERQLMIERANEADRVIYRLKRKAFKDHEEGKSEKDILEEMALHRVRCPALGPDDHCLIYDVRPITCRIYGIPTSIGGRAHTCGTSGFKQGEAYPTVRLDSIYQRLYEISFALADHIKSRYAGLAEILVPLSMAVLTDYTEEYLGVKSETEPPTKE